MSRDHPPAEATRLANDPRGLIVCAEGGGGTSIRVRGPWIARCWDNVGWADVSRGGGGRESVDDDDEVEVVLHDESRRQRTGGEGIRWEVA